MGMFTSGQAGQIAYTVIVAQDGSGDFNGNTGDVIQQAIDYAGAGSNIFIKEGTYYITSTINVSNNYVTIDCVYGGSTFVFVGNITAISVTGQGCRLVNMQFYGSGVPGGTAYAVSVTGQRDLLEYCEVYLSPANGFYISSDYGMSTGCTAMYNAGTGFFIDCIGFPVRFAISSSNVVGFYFNDNSNSVGGIDTSAIDSNVSYGIYIKGYVDVTLTNMIISKNAHGIYVENSYQIFIRGCRVAGNTGYGIYFSNCMYSMVADNISGKHLDTTAQNYGIYEVGLSDYNIFNSNGGFQNTVANFSFIGGNTLAFGNANW